MTGYRGPRGKRPTPEVKARALLDTYGRAGAAVVAAQNATRARTDANAQWWGCVLRHVRLEYEGS